MSTTNHHTDELICVRDAAKRLPSCQSGKRVHIATIYRYILSGKLPAVKRGRSLFVRVSDLERLHEPVPVRGPYRVDGGINWRSHERAMEELRRMGMV